MVRAAFEGDPAVPSEWPEVARWTLQMPRAVAQSFGSQIDGDYHAIGLVEGAPVYARSGPNGAAMIGFEAERCHQLAQCVRVFAK